MAEIVGGFGTAHILMGRGSAGATGERVFTGMRHLSARVRALAPDLIVIFSSDHLYNFDLNVQIPFSVAADAILHPYGDMHLPREPLKGHAPFADGFIAHAGGQGVDLAKLHAYRPDHGVVLPTLLISPERTLPIVPIIVNTAMSPVPTPRRAWALGAALGDYVRTQRPAGERVAVVAAGGLSHWLGVPEMGRINPDFDAKVMELCLHNRAAEMADWTSQQIEDEAGNGGLEVLCWIAMAAALGDCRGEKIYYEAVPEWLTGMGGIALQPLAAA